MFNVERREHGTFVPERHLPDLLATLPDVLLVVDDHATILYANAAAITSVGATKEALLGGTLWQWFPHLVTLEFHQALGKVLHARQPFQVKYRSLVTSTWFHLYLWPTSAGIAIVIHEGGEPTRPQKTFHQQELELQDVLECVSTSVVILTPEGRVLNINQAPLTSARMQRADVLGKLFAKTFWWSDAPAAQQHMSAAIARASRGETIHFEVRIRTHAGHSDRAVTITPHLDGDGRVDYLTYTSSDITARKQIEDELRSLVDSMLQIVWMARPDGSMVYMNRRWRDYTGMTTEQAQGNGWLQDVHPDDQQTTLAAWRTALQTGGVYEVEQRLRQGTTGAYCWFLARGAPCKDQRGAIVKWVGTCTDIEDQKRTEEALRQSQRRVNHLMNSSIIGIFLTEGDDIVEANATFLRMTGYMQEDLRQRRVNWASMTLPMYTSLAQQVHQELAIQKYTTPFETELVCRDGSRLPVLMGGVIFQEQVLQGIGFVLDNSARKELEQRKDNFLSMASHELKTPLTAVKIQTQLVRKRLVRQGLAEAAAALARIEGPAKQLERLIGELLDVSKIQAGRLEYLQEPVDLDALLHEVAETMQQMSTTHTIVVRGATAHVLVGDKGRLEQVFINLLSNAMKYSPDASTIEIEASASAEIATICVCDHGIGIPREQREKIFERFYRVADLSQRMVPGLGMGLYIVAEIVKQHGGTITVDSEGGKGSTFQVTLPLRGAGQCGVRLPHHHAMDGEA
jgi:PAS domain S-box-containing protein